MRVITVMAAECEMTQECGRIGTTSELSRCTMAHEKTLIRRKHVNNTLSKLAPQLGDKERRIQEGCCINGLFLERSSLCNVKTGIIIIDLQVS